MIDFALLRVRGAPSATVPFNKRKPIKLTGNRTTFSQGASSQVRLI